MLYKKVLPGIQSLAAQPCRGKMHKAGNEMVEAGAGWTLWRKIKSEKSIQYFIDDGLVCSNARPYLQQCTTMDSAQCIAI